MCQLAFVYRVFMDFLFSESNKMVTKYAKIPPLCPANGGITQNENIKKIILNPNVMQRYGFSCKAANLIRYNIATT